MFGNEATMNEMNSDDCQLAVDICYDSQVKPILGPGLQLLDPERVSMFNR